MNIRPPAAVLALVILALSLTGCTYYQIDDPHSGKTYYTTNWEAKGVESGVIVFKDAATGSKVTLASHEIRKIKERKYKASVSKQIADQP
ncbi:MAG: hypothetical protein AAGG38_04685 [Planctomycetota bacterium]